MLTADELKRLYARYSSARWRGDAAGEALESWFRRHWVEASPPDRPDVTPAAVSPHGAGGRGILWYEGQAVILGFVPGQSGCYVIKRTEAPPIATTPRPAPGPHTAPLRSVAHFQSGTYARYLTIEQTGPVSARP